MGGLGRSRLGTSGRAGRNRNGWTRLFGSLAVVATLTSLTGSHAGHSGTSRVSLSSTGAEANGTSSSGRTSADGRYVAFQSQASDLVSDDTNGFEDVFVRDRLLGTTTRVSVASDGTQSDADSVNSSISADGRYVAFESRARTLGVDSSTSHVYLHDRLTGETTLASRNGPYVGDGASFSPSISADGRHVAFTSYATVFDLAVGSQVYVYDVAAGTTHIASKSLSGGGGNAESDAATISEDGRFVAFQSYAANLVPGDVNGAPDVFRFDSLTGTVELVSVGRDGDLADSVSSEPSISADGNRVAFASSASNLVALDVNGVADIFVRDIAASTTILASVTQHGLPADELSFDPSISADGWAVAFVTYARDMAGYVVVRDLLTGTTTREEMPYSGVFADRAVDGPSLSADGRYIVFQSEASNLVAGDTNASADVFLRDRGPRSCSAGSRESGAASTLVADLVGAGTVPGCLLASAGL